jgi:hypothetical protein
MAEEIKTVMMDLKSAKILKEGQTIVHYKTVEGKQTNKVLERQGILEFDGDTFVKKVENVTDIPQTLNITAPAKPTFAYFEFGNEGVLTMWPENREYGLDGTKEDMKHKGLIEKIMEKIGYKSSRVLNP